MENLNKSSIVFLHGNSCSSDYFIFQKESELLNRFDLHFINYSDSSECSISSLASKVLARVKDLNLENVTLAGHSLGGHIAIRAANLDSEKCIKGLFVWGTPLFGEALRFDLAFNQVPELGLLFSETWSQDNLQSLYSLFFSNNSNKDEKELLLKMLENSSGIFRKSLGETIARDEHFNEIEFVSSLSIPTLIAFGTKDKIINGNYINQHLKDLNIVKIFGSHSVHFDNFKVFNETLYDFADDVVFCEPSLLTLRKNNEFTREY